MRVNWVTRIFAALLAAATVLSARPDVSTAGSAGAPPSRWAVARVQGMLTTPLAENHVEAWNDCGSGVLHYLSFSASIDVNSSAGFLGSFEYVVGHRYGLELGLLYWNRIVNLEFDATGVEVRGSPNFIMPTLGVNYHFLVDGTKDLYAGGLVALGVIATGFYTDIEVSKDVALGLNLGLDYYVRRSWSVGGTIKYVDFGELDFSVLPPGVSGFICDNGLFGLGAMNVLSLTFGVGYRF
jgi:opacity protein-like surface antigen